MGQVADIAGRIDHSLLQPSLDDEALAAGCRYAFEAGVASVCIKPYAVRLASAILAGSAVKVGTVVGFPQGGHTTSTKMFEAEQALADGATELDMVVNVGKVKSADWGYVGNDIGAVLQMARARGALVKVIFENSLLADDEKIRLCEICTQLGVDFIKTSTGYGEGGATNEDLILMRHHAGEQVQIKAAGGVRSLDRMLEVLSLGVTRVGATATRSILREARERWGV
jgi:deoxyribose-phosphate aldolase